MLDHHWDAVGADYVLTEIGGWSQVGDDGVRRVTVNVAEKGLAWRRLRVHGTPGHGSMPYGADNALSPRPRSSAGWRPTAPSRNLDDLWQARVAALDLARRPARRARPTRRASTTRSPRCRPATARVAHACSHTTISPNVVHGGQKTNTIPDVVDIDVDIRTVPGDTTDGRRRLPRRGPRRARATGSRSAPLQAVRVDPLGRSATRCGTSLAHAHPGRLPRRRAACPA